MGYSLINKLVVLCTVLFFVGAIIHLGSFTSRSTSLDSADLNKYLSDIPDWRRKKITVLDPEVVDLLKLDEYLNSEYSNKMGSVSLYIGQYHSAKKVGAVHHPLVCLPGQGLKVTQRATGKLLVSKKSKTYNISYSSIISESDNQKNLIFYWFQFGESAYTNTFHQKLASFWSSITGHGQKNAYIRITTNLNGKSLDMAKSLITEFIDDFYPVYVTYLTQNDSDAT